MRNIIFSRKHGIKNKFVLKFFKYLIKYEVIYI
jgi:hypothetical protein